jgi:hypothetical protein
MDEISGRQGLLLVFHRVPSGRENTVVNRVFQPPAVGG